MEVRLKFKVNLGRDKRESRRPFPGIWDNELNSSTIPPKTGWVVTLIPVDNNSLITKYIQPLKEGRHENFNRVHSNVHRGQAGEHQKGDVNRALTSSQKIS